MNNHIYSHLSQVCYHDIFASINNYHDIFASISNIKNLPVRRCDNPVVFEMEERELPSPADADDRDAQIDCVQGLVFLFFVDSIVY